MTTPKRNEAVAWAVVVDGTPDYASVHKYACDSEAGVYGIGPTVSVEPLYSHEQMDDLQGEVSRLRGAKDRIQQALNAFEVPKMSESKAEYYKAGARAVIALVNANLEPPTDGR